MTRHLTPEDIDRFRRGWSSGSEVLELSRHLQECDTCSVLARDEVDLDAAAAAVRDDLGIDDRETSPHRWQWLAAAAAVVVVLIGAIVVVARRPAPMKPMMTTAPPPQPVSVGYGRADWDSATAEARRSGRVELPEEVRALHRTPDPFRGASAGSAPALSPSGEAISEQQPHFQWTAAARGPYVVHIFLGREEVAHSPMLSLPTWTPDRPLQRGRTYAWQVTAGHGVIIPSPPAPPALFRIIDDQSANDVAEASRRFPQDHLLLGVVCARAGLQRCAEDELARYAAERPADRSAQSLAASVRK